MGYSYSNTDGTGNRTGTITASVTSTGGSLGAGTAPNLVNGSKTANASNATWFNGGTDWRVLFDFGSGRTIRQARWFQDATNTHGIWKWRGSNDNSTFFDIGGTFTLGGVNAGAGDIHHSLQDNTTSYRYYQLFQVSGTVSSAPWLTEIEFFINGTTDDLADQSYKSPIGGGVAADGQSSSSGGNGVDRSSLITLTAVYTIASGGQVATNLFDGAAGNNTTDSIDFANGLQSPRPSFKFDFGSGKKYVITKMTWEQNTSSNQGTWDIAGSNDDSSYTTLSAAVDIVNGSSLNQSSWTNTTGYRYYKMTQVGGTNSSSPWVHEIYFYGVLDTRSTDPTGTWDSTEAPDVFAASSAPAGTWASIEAADTFAATGYPQLTGSWVSTEAKDVMAFTGVSSAPFGLDGSAKGHTNGTTTTCAATLTTTASHDVIVACIETKGGTVSGIADVAGLTWTKRTSFNPASNSTVDMEIWWAHAPSPLTADVITATLSSTAGVSMIVFAVSGANFGAPFDGHNANSIKVDNAGSGNPSAVITTDDTRGGFIFGVIGSDDGGGSVTSVATGMNVFLDAETTTTGQVDRVAVGYKIATANQTNFSLSFTQNGGGANDRYLMADCIIAGGYTGTWASTEAADVFAATGGILGGSWHSTEPADIWAAMGYPQLTGSWASTEAKDVLDFHGPIQGSWVSTESADIAAMVGALVPALGLDGIASGGVSGAPSTTSTVTLTTTHTNDVIVVCVNTGGNFNRGHVTGIADTAGLTWRKRQQRYVVGVTPSVEIWWAHAPLALTSDVITVTTTSTGATALTAFGVCGANYLAPWDRNPQAAWFADNYGSGNPTSPTVTNASHTFMFAWYAGLVNQTGAVLNPDFTWLSAVQATETSGFTMYSALAAHIEHGGPYTGTTAFGQVGGSAGRRTVMTDTIVSYSLAGTDDQVRWFFDGYMPFGPGVLTLTGSANSITQPLSTFEGNEVVMVAVYISSLTGASVDSISDASGGTSPWHFRGRVANDSGSVALELWYAWSNVAFSTADITVTFNHASPGDTVGFTACGVKGPNFFQIFDPDVSLPATDHFEGTPFPPPSVDNISTVNPNCLTLAFAVSPDTDINGSILAPFAQTTTDGTSGNGPAGFTPLQSDGPPAFIATGFYFQHDQMAADTAEFGTSPAPSSWMVLADSLPVGLPTPPTGTWHSIEGVDVVNIAGYVPAFATWASVESPDFFGGTPFQAPYNGIGWLGHIPAFATLAVTEAKDTLHAAAWVIGQPLTGTWHSVEGADRMGASNRPTVTGIWASHETADNWSSAGFLLPKAAPAPPTRKRRLMVIN